MFAVPIACANVCSPIAIAPLNCPSPIASAPWPRAIAKLVPVLEQLAPPEPDPAVMPLIDAHVAAAIPAPHRVAAASPQATEPSKTPVVRLRTSRFMDRPFVAYLPQPSTSASIIAPPPIWP